MSQVSYSLDTSAILTAWHEVYRPASFEGFWRKLEELIAADRCVATDEVLRELSKKDDDAHAWAKAQTKLAVALEEDQIVVAKQLVNDHPTLAKQRLGRMRADGFVIALAKCRGLTVVTAENRRGLEKVPNICEAAGVPCIGLPDMIEAEGWTFR